MKQSDLLKKSSNSSKGQLAAFEEIVANMIRGTSPDGPAMTCTYYGQVLSALQWFCRAEEDEKGETITTRGKAALDYLFESMADKMESEKTVAGLAELEVVMVPCTCIAIPFCFDMVCNVGFLCSMY